MIALESRTQECTLLVKDLRTLLLDLPMRAQDGDALDGFEALVDVAALYGKLRAQEECLAYRLMLCLEWHEYRQQAQQMYARFEERKKRWNTRAIRENPGAFFLECTDIALDILLFLDCSMTAYSIADRYGVT